MRSAFVAVLVAASALVLVPVFAQTSWALPNQVRQPGYTGTMLFLARGGIWQMDLATLQPRPFLQLPSGTITHVSHSWDRQRLAYAMSMRGPDFRLLESRIVVASADGAGPQTLVHEDRTGSVLDWPSWSPDGTRLTYTKTLFDYRVERVEEVDLATGARTLIAEAG
jgi:hypothetical protein